MANRGKLLVFSAPSGSGKSTVINRLKELNAFPFAFSVSATNRPPRPFEEDGKDYYFLSTEDFCKRLQNGDFVEYCEVYEGRYYGTLKSELEDRCSRGENIILDVDVEGACNIKRLYGDDALTIFVMPPSIETLRSRLEGRGTDSPDKINERLSRAEYEMGYADKYDVRIINDNLETAVNDCIKHVKEFLDC